MNDDEGTGVAKNAFDSLYSHTLSFQHVWRANVIIEVGAHKGWCQKGYEHLDDRPPGVVTTLPAWFDVFFHPISTLNKASVLAESSNPPRYIYIDLWGSGSSGWKYDNYKTPFFPHYLKNPFQPCEIHFHPLGECKFPAHCAPRAVRVRLICPQWPRFTLWRHQCWIK